MNTNDKRILALLSALIQTQWSANGRLSRLWVLNQAQNTQSQGVLGFLLISAQFSSFITSVNQEQLHWEKSQAFFWDRVCHNEVSASCPVDFDECRICLHWFYWHFPSALPCTQLTGYAQQQMPPPGSQKSTPELVSFLSVHNVTAVFSLNLLVWKENSWHEYVWYQKLAGHIKPMWISFRIVRFVWVMQPESTARTSYRLAALS